MFAGRHRRRGEDDLALAPDASDLDVHGSAPRRRQVKTELFSWNNGLRPAITGDCLSRHLSTVIGVNAVQGLSTDRPAGSGSDFPNYARGSSRPAISDDADVKPEGEIRWISRG